MKDHCQKPQVRFHRPIFALFLGLATFFASGSMFAEPPSYDCLETLRYRVAFDEPITVGSTGEIVKEKTVKVGPARIGRHGGKQIQLIRVGDNWESTYTTLMLDVQGDPRWFIEAYGTEVARFFGFEIISPNIIWVPDRNEFNAAIEKLNQVLVDPIPFRFAKLDDDGPEDLVRGFSEVPARVVMGEPTQESLSDKKSDEGNLFIHDVSYHTGLIGQPTYIFRRGQLQAQVATALANYLQELSTLPHYSGYSFVLRSWALKIFKKASLDVDVGSASHSHTLIRIDNLEGGTPLKVYGERFEEYPEDLIENIFITLESMQREEPLKIPGLPLNYSGAIGYMEQFLELHPEINWPTIRVDPEQPELILGDEANDFKKRSALLVSQHKKRRGEIIEAVQKLLAGAR